MYIVIQHSTVVRWDFPTYASAAAYAATLVDAIVDFLPVAVPCRLAA